MVNVGIYKRHPLYIHFDEILEFYEREDIHESIYIKSS